MRLERREFLSDLFVISFSGFLELLQIALLILMLPFN